MGIRKNAKLLVKTEGACSGDFCTECCCESYCIQQGETDNSYPIEDSKCLEIAVQYLQEHPKKIKKLPYKMFYNIMKDLMNMEDACPKEDNILWINDLIREFGYEVKE
jgi:hypothetical protein